MNTPSLTLLSALALAFASGTCQAQQIDASRSHAAALVPADTPVPPHGATADHGMALSPLMTRAVAQRNAEGKLAVKCDLDGSPARHGGKFNPPTRKIQ